MSSITTLVVFLTLFCVIADGCLLVGGGCLRRDVGIFTGVGQVDKGGLTDERILCCRQYKPVLEVLAPIVGTLG